MPERQRDAAREDEGRAGPRGRSDTPTPGQIEDRVQERTVCVPGDGGPVDARSESWRE